MPGTQKNKNGKPDHPNKGGPAPFELESVLAVPPAPLPAPDPTLAAVPMVFGGVEFSIKRMFTGTDVIAASKLLTFDIPDPPNVDGLTDDEAKNARDAYPKTVSEAYEANAVAQIGGLLETGNAADVWSAMRELPKVVSDHLTMSLYKVSGLVDAEGKFRGLSVS